MVYEWVANAPTPVLTVIGDNSGEITNVRFSWMNHCNYCRKAFHMWTDGGKITVSVSGGAKFHPAGKPNPPATCPTCGHDWPIGRKLPTWVPYPPCPVYQAYRLVNVFWESRRAA